ncbi:MAG: L-threonylcarbamoyladenylate synthase [Bacillota bacterium]|nr:L-threonylcarbamoyladenylate synthase [Bacillota bacterium]
MTRRIINISGTLLFNPDQNSIARAAAIIKRGGLVAFPTETVYGLGADATSEEAVRKIFKAKGRPSDNPLIVHVASPEQLRMVAASTTDEVIELTGKFWPGPLSLVLPRAQNIPAVVSAGLPTVAVRMPDHPVALALIRSAALPIAAPSANLSGRPSPTSFVHVLEDLAGRIDAVIRAGACPIGVESTVLDLSGQQPVILRPGGVSREKLEEFFGQQILVAGPEGTHDLPSSPGMKYRHYSPYASIILVKGPPEERRCLIEILYAQCRKRKVKVEILNSVVDDFLFTRSSNDKMTELAAKLFQILRDMDRRGTELILAEEIEPEGLGLAVMNRLQKASSMVIRIKGRIVRKERPV